MYSLRRCLACLIFRLLIGLSLNGGLTPITPSILRISVHPLADDYSKVAGLTCRTIIENKRSSRFVLQLIALPHGGFFDLFGLAIPSAALVKA